MKRFLLPLSLLLLVLLLAACSAAGGSVEPAVDAPVPTDTVEPAPATPEPELTPTEVASPEEALTAACPEPGEGEQLLADPLHGFCLLYPDVMKVERPNPDGVSLVVGSLLNVSDPRLDIFIQDAGGRTAAQAADELAAGFADFSLERSETTVGGEPAVVLDQVPGQELRRVVYIVHDGYLYELSFSPVGADQAEIAGRTGGVYQRVLDSFTFIPRTDVLPAGFDCLQAGPETQAVVNETQNYCMLLPAEYTVEMPDADHTLAFVGSMQDVEHPKLFIETFPAEGRTREAIADELAADAVAAIPGFEPQRSFGLSLGYEPAEILLQMPGQDLGRQLVVVHADTAYVFTFVPDDEGQGEAYSEMEALLDMVVRTFRFLK